MVPDTKVREYHTEDWGWGGVGALGADTSSTVAELKAPEGPASPSRKHLLLHHVLGADPVKSQRLPMFKFLTEQVVLHIQPQAAHCAAVAARMQCQRQTPARGRRLVTCTGRRYGAQEAFSLHGRFYRPQGALGSKSGPRLKRANSKEGQGLPGLNPFIFHVLMQR